MHRREFLKAAASTGAICNGEPIKQRARGGLRIAYLSEHTLLDILTGQIRVVPPTPDATIVRTWIDHPQAAIGLMLQSRAWEPCREGERPETVQLELVRHQPTTEFSI